MLHYLKLAINGIIELLKGPYKWFAIFFMAFLYRIEFMSDVGFGLAKIMQVVTVFGLLYMLYRERRNWIDLLTRKMNMPVKSVTWLYIFALCTTLWAINPQFAFFLSFQNLVMIMLFTMAFSIFDDLYNMERGFIFFTFTIVTFEFIASRIETTSLFNHLLQSGSLSAMMLSYCAGEFMVCDAHDVERRSLLKYSAVAFMFYLVVNTSGGANAAAAVAVGMAMLLSGKYVYALLVIIVGGVLFFNQDLIDSLILTLMPGKNMETIKIGNGRDAIWENLLRYADQKPWLGWGFACIERVQQTGIIGGQSLSDAHSNYVGMYGSLGIVGCVFFGWHLLATGIHLFKRRMQTGFLGLLTAFTCATINGYSYGFLSGKTCSITICYFIVIILSYYYDNISLEEEDVSERYEEMLK